MATNDQLNTGNIPLPVAHGGTGLASTTANSILYSSSTSVIADLPTGNNGVIITNGSGVPSVSSTLPNNVQIKNLVMGANSAVSVNASAPANSLQVTSAGYRKQAIQPTWKIGTAGLSNVTGNATVYQILFETVLIDNASGYSAATGIYTVPVTGNYLIMCRLEWTGLTASFTQLDWRIRQSGSNDTYQFLFKPSTILTAAGKLIMTGSKILRVVAGGTGTLKILTTGVGSTKTISIGAESFFAGYLLS